MKTLNEIYIKCPVCNTKYIIDKNDIENFFKCEKCNNDFYGRDNFYENNIENDAVYILNITVPYNKFLGKSIDIEVQFNFNKNRIELILNKINDKIKNKILSYFNLKLNCVDIINFNFTSFFSDIVINNIFFKGQNISINEFLEIYLNYKISNNSFIELSKGKSLFESDNGESLKLYKDYILINHKGIFSILGEQGIQGEKRIPISQITCTQVKEPGVFVGYIQFSIHGEVGVKGGITKSINDENTVRFSNINQYYLAKLIENYIYGEMNRENTNKNQLQISISDEVIKLKKLLDDNIITHEQFNDLINKITF